MTHENQFYKIILKNCKSLDTYSIKVQNELKQPCVTGDFQDVYEDS